MKNYLLNLFITLFTLNGLLAQEQWQRLPGPVGTEVTSIQKFDNKIYAGTYSGIFTSVDNGVSWQPDTNGIDGGMFIWSMASNGETLIAATSVGVYYKTPGNPWTISNMLNIMMKVISNGDVFLAKAYSNFNLYRSTDGIHWTSTGHSVGGIGTNGSTFFIDTTADMLRSSNGVNWQPINLSLPGYGISAIGGDGTVLMVSRFEGGVYRSVDNGDSFTQISMPTQSTFPYRAHNFAYHGNTIYANVFSQTDEIYYSNDYGLTWQKRNPGLYPSVFGWGGMIVEDDYQLVASYEGIHRSTDGGATWTFDASNGLANSTVNGLLENQGKLHALTGFDVGGSYGFYSSTDLGQSWSVPAAQHFGRNGNLSFGTVVNNVLLVKNGYTLSRSVDNGITWTNILTAPDNMTALHTSGNRVIMATNMNKIYYSDDLGLTWTQATTANPVVNCITSKNGVLYAGTSTGIQKSTNNGTTWTNLPAVIGGPYDVMAMAANDTHLFAAVQSGGQYIQLYRSADNGATWQNIQGTLPQGYWSTIGILGSTLLVGTDIQGVDFTASYLYKSTDNGTTWTNFNQGMFVTSDITYIGHHSGKWYAGTESAGLWVFEGTTLGTDEFSSPRSFTVSPNPTNGTAYVAGLDPDVASELILSDITGRIVRKIEVDANAISGNAFAVDLQDLRSAVYLLQIITPSGRQTVKLVKE